MWRAASLNKLVCDSHVQIRKGESGDVESRGLNSSRRRARRRGKYIAHPQECCIGRCCDRRPRTESCHFRGWRSARLEETKLRFGLCRTFNASNPAAARTSPFPKRGCSAWAARSAVKFFVLILRPLRACSVEARRDFLPCLWTNLSGKPTRITDPGKPQPRLQYAPQVGVACSVASRSAACSRRPLVGIGWQYFQAQRINLPRLTDRGTALSGGYRGEERG